MYANETTKGVYQSGGCRCLQFGGFGFKGVRVQELKDLGLRKFQIMFKGSQLEAKHSPSREKARNQSESDSHSVQNPASPPVPGPSTRVKSVDQEDKSC